MIRVLVIDDAREIRELLRVQLGKAGMSVTVASNATEGAELAGQKRPDIVLLDLEMPVRDGVSCLQEIRARPQTATVPVFVISGVPVREVITRIARMGVSGVILKNDRLVVEVVSRIRKLLKLQESSEDAGVAAESTPTTTGVPGERASIGSANPPASGWTASPVIKPGPPSPNAVVSPEQEDRESMRVSVLQLDGDSMDIERATEELRTLKPLMPRAVLMERVLEGTDLRALKPAAQQVLNLTLSSTASLDRIANAIKQDQALSLKVLKVANSPLFSSGERVETVQKAVSRIGVEQIRSTVLGLAVMDRFGSVNLANRIKADWFWEHSIACGLTASKIAQMRGAPPDEIDSMFTAGLLHDIGRVIYAERLGDEYTGVIDVADQLELPLETIESRLLLVNHADLTDRLLREWSFSLELINPIALHHLSVSSIRSVVTRMAESVATLGLANRLAHALLLGSSGNEMIYPIEEFVGFLSISGDQIQRLCQSVPNLTLDLKLQMLTHGADIGASLLDSAREQLTAPVRPLHIAVNPSFNATAIVLDRLCPPDPTDAPNIAVIRVATAGERAPLMSQLRQAEESAGVQNLPTLVVGTGASCLFAEGALGGRPIQQVIVPLRLTRLIRSINMLTNPGLSPVEPQSD